MLSESHTAAHKCSIDGPHRSHKAQTCLELVICAPPPPHWYEIMAQRRPGPAPRWEGAARRCVLPPPPPQPPQPPPQPPQQPPPPPLRRRCARPAAAGASPARSTLGRQRNGLSPRGWSFDPPAGRKRGGARGQGRAAACGGAARDLPPLALPPGAAGALPARCLLRLKRQGLSTFLLLR